MAIHSLTEVKDCIVLIHFNSASLSMSHSEVLPTKALILCWS